MYVSRGIRRSLLTTAFGLAVLAAISTTAAAQTARIQIVHDSPDPAVEWLSLYLNDIKVADSLLFRNATPYLEVPAGIGIQAGFAPLNSTSSNDVFKTVTINLDPGKDYVVVILGVIDLNHRANPDGIPIDLRLLVSETRPDAATLETSDYLFINGTTDAPNLDFRQRGKDPIVSGVAYGTAVGYVAYDKYVYTMDVAPTEAPERILGSFDLDVGFLMDKAFTLITSGFLNKFENANGPQLKLMVVTTTGQTVTVDPAEPTEDLATMQVINNSPDVNFPNGFDIYFNGGRAINDLRFKNVTPFFGIPGNATLTIEIKNSTGGLPIRTTALTVDPGKNYLLMITGVVVTSQYAPNPDGEPTDLAITVNQSIRLFPSKLGVGEFVFAHGVPDAPAADMEITDLEDPITDVPFAEMTGYRDISQVDDVLAEMVPSGSDLPAIARHRINLPFVLGRTFVMYAAGFLRPENNRNGEKAQIMLAFPEGVVVALRFREIATEAARLQLIHASPEPSLQTADLYVDYDLVADDATFMSGTPFVDVPARKTVTISVAPPESEGVEDATASFKMQFDDATAYAGLLSGVASPTAFAPNPDGRPTALGLHVIGDALENGIDGSQLTVLAANEITDAPASNFTSEGTQVLAQGIRYAQAGDYAVVPALYRYIDVRRQANDTRVGASYINFENLAGRAGILVASGFADPAANGDGPGFSTFLVLDDGSTIPSDQNIVSNESDSPEAAGSIRLQGNYPNPFTDETNIVIDLPESSEVTIKLIDATGRIVRRRPPVLLPAGIGQTIGISANDLPAGMYLYSIVVASTSGTREVRGRMMRIK